MQAYRSKATSLAVQYAGQDIPDVTCGGSSTDEAVRQAARQLNGCDPSRANLPHVHTAQVGGLGVLTPGCWIMPVRGGPFCVVEDAQFRAHFEVPEPFVENPPAEPYVDQVPANEPVATEPAAADAPAAEELGAAKAAPAADEPAAPAEEAALPKHARKKARQ